jgi:hypothetical protein
MIWTSSLLTASFVLAELAAAAGGAAAAFGGSGGFGPLAFLGMTRGALPAASDEGAEEEADVADDLEAASFFSEDAPEGLCADTPPLGCEEASANRSSGISSIRLGLGEGVFEAMLLDDGIKQRGSNVCKIEVLRSSYEKQTTKLTTSNAGCTRIYRDWNPRFERPTMSASSTRERAADVLFFHESHCTSGANPTQYGRDRPAGSCRGMVEAQGKTLGRF